MGLSEYGLFATVEKLTDHTNSSIDQQTESDIESIIKLELSMTSMKLSFTAGKNDIDSNKLILSKMAQCVGYASFYATTCNYLFRKI